MQLRISTSNLINTGMAIERALERLFPEEADRCVFIIDDLMCAEPLDNGNVYHARRDSYLLKDHARSDSRAKAYLERGEESFTWHEFRPMKSLAKWIGDEVDVITEREYGRATVFTEFSEPLLPHGTKRRLYRLDDITPDERKRLRESAVLTQLQVADILGISEGAFAKWERGKSQPATELHAERYANFLAWLAKLEEVEGRKMKVDR